MNILRTRPFAAILIALLILLALSGVAYALGRSLGYFPGVGLVEQNAPFHALPEPVSQTRDGVTITIKQATLNADQMSVTLLVESIPAEKRSFWILPNSKWCMSNPELHLLDGQVVKLSSATLNPFGWWLRKSIKIFIHSDGYLRYDFVRTMYSDLRGSRVSS